MAQGAWTTRPISPKQIALIDRLVGEKTVGALDESLLEILADVQSDVEITQGTAGTLIDALIALPRKPRTFTVDTTVTLLSTWEARKKAADDTSAAYTAADEKATAAKEAAGGIDAEGNCTTCHRTSRWDGEDGTCGNSVEWRGSDYSMWGNCSGREKGTAATAAAGALRLPLLDLLTAANHARDAAEKFVKGDWAVNVRGRKIPKGTTGQVIATNDGQYGPSVLLLLADGTKAWTAQRNVEHTEAPS